MSLISVVSLVVTAMAVARLTRMITTDVIAIPLRKKVLGFSGDLGWWTMLIHCPYCVSVWVAAVAAPLWWFFGTDAWFFVLAAWMAIAQFVSFATKIDQG